MKRFFMIWLAVFAAVSGGIKASTIDTALSTATLINLGGGGGGGGPSAAGAAIPGGIVNEVLRVAREHYGYTMGEMQGMYAVGTCTITEIINPADLLHRTFLVSVVGRTDLIVVLGDL